MKERGIAFLTGLWRLLAAIWIFLIIGGAVGVVGNIIFTYVTTGTINFTDPRTLSITSLLTAHLLLVIIFVLLALVLTASAYWAYHHEKLEAQQKKQAHEDALVDVAKGVADIGAGVRAALEERKASPPVEPLPSQQETSQSSSTWNVPYRRNPFFTGQGAKNCSNNFTIISHKTRPQP